MATWSKEQVRQYPSPEEFAKKVQAYKIYESETGFHTVRYPHDDVAIRSSSSIRNLRLIWEKK
jgi:hypothetical protein